MLKTSVILTALLALVSFAALAQDNKVEVKAYPMLSECPDDAQMKSYPMLSEEGQDTQAKVYPMLGEEGAIDLQQHAPWR